MRIRPNNAVIALLAAATLLPATETSAQLQSPKQFLGYELGERFTPYNRVADYVNHVASESAAVELVQYGETNEHRPLFVAVISGLPAGSAREAVRLNNLRLAGLVDGAGVAAGARPVVWLSYNVHGNESVSTEAAMKVLYELADPTNERSKQWLEGAIVIIDPCINPDGRDRYVNWYNTTVGRFPNPNADDWSHNEPWPGGRTNHYYFDLNRDWAWVTQKETKERLKVYSQWMPQVHVDFHEQGVNSPYYFAPAAKPYHEDVTDWQAEMQGIIGQNNARYFDRNGWLYFTAEEFDLFYPGYGDTWPTYNGAIGMTYEQAGSGFAGLGVETAEGDTLTLADRIAHHYTTSLATIEASVQNAERLVKEFESYFKSAVANPPGKYSSYVVSAATKPDAVSDLADLLDAQGIRYEFAAAAQTVRGFVYQDASEGSFAVSRDDLVIPAAQPKARLVKILFEPNSVLTDSLTYDITAWAQPYAFGVPVVATTSKVPTGGGRSAAASATKPSEPAYAWVAEWKSVRDQQFVSALLRKGVNLRMASRPFRAGGMDYDRGSVVITRAGNSKVAEELDRLVVSAANEFGQTVTPLQSGSIGNGADFGSSSFEYLSAPSIGVVGGEGVSSGSYGEVWYYFDTVLKYPITTIPAENLSRVDLSDYDVLVLPSSGFGATFSESMLTDLQSWLRSGGRLIAIGRAVDALSGKKGFELNRRKSKEDTTAVTPETAKWADETRRRISDDVIGGIYKVLIDATHPVGYGLGDSYFALKYSSSSFEPMKRGDGWNVGVIKDGRPVSGFAGYETTKSVQNSVAVAVQNIGRGSVVYLIDDPLYRGFWRAGNQLFGNAVLAK